MQVSTSWRVGMYSFLVGTIASIAWAVYELTSKPDGGAFWIALGFALFFGFFAATDWVMLRRTPRGR